MRNGLTRSPFDGNGHVKCPGVCGNYGRSIAICEKSTMPTLQQGSGCHRESRGVPCLAFHNGVGKLDGPGSVIEAQGRDRVGRTALRNDIACAPFTSTTLSGHAKLELHFVERHSGTCMTCNLAIRNSTANANNHGSEAQLAGCYLSLDYKYESVAFAITMAHGR
jgi:hypothetical protein